VSTLPARSLALPIEHSGRAADTARLSVGAACIATAATHLMLLRRALGPDEGGFLVIAQHWRESGPYLYGPLWVDRPPGLITVFAVANFLGPWGVRLVMTAVAVALVLVLSKAAATVAGPAAGPWTAWTAYALGSSVLLQAGQLNGEYAAILCVSISMLLVLRAMHESGRNTLALGVGAGLAAAAALMMKQNFLDGFVFAALFLGLTALRDRRHLHLVSTIARGMAAGALLVAAVALAWSAHHGGPRALFDAMYGFRARATEVMRLGPWVNPDRRAVDLIILCIGSGLLVLGTHIAIQNRRSLRSRSPLAWALAGTAFFELLALIAGANFWPHYALAFIPVVSLGAGVASSQGRPGWVATQRIVAAMATLTAVITPTVALVNGPGMAWTIGHWVSRSAASHDSIVVTYTHPNIVAASGLRPAYPYLWSLPARTLDPHLSTLTETLDRPTHAPTWVVIWDHPHEWGLDKSGQLQRALHAHYRLVAHVCRHPVWLRSDVSRTLAPLPTNCGGGAL
jgi:4-amino-4-deoxy-L-arabinose transferase-like glycosyltransferase